MDPTAWALDHHMDPATQPYPIDGYSGCRHATETRAYCNLLRKQDEAMAQHIMFLTLVGMLYSASEGM